jgi:CcmD family protein
MKNLGSVMAAYLASWAIFFVYYWSVGRRVSRLRDDVERLKSTLTKTSRP